MKRPHPLEIATGTRLYFHETQVRCDSESLQKGQFVTYKPAVHHGKPQAQEIILLEEETDELVLRQAFTGDYSEAVLIAARLLFPKIGSQQRIQLALSALPRLSDFEQRQLALLIPDKSLRVLGAQPLRAIVPVRRRITIWNAMPKPESIIEEVQAELLTPSPIGFEGAERSKLVESLNPTILALVKARALRQLLPLAERLLLYAKMECDDSLLDELLEALDKAEDAAQSQFAEPFWSRLVKQNSITSLASDRLKPVRDRSPMSVRIQVWNKARDPVQFLREIASAVKKHQPASERADVIKRLRPEYLMLPGARKLRCLLPLADRFSVYVKMNCDDRILAEITYAMQQEGKIAKEHSPSREFWSCKAPSPEDPLFDIAPRYYKVDYWTTCYRDLLDALTGLVKLQTLPEHSWAPRDVYGKAITRYDRQLSSLWQQRPKQDEEPKMLSARCAEKAAMQFYQGLGHKVRDVASDQLNSSAKDWTTHDLELDTTDAIDVKNTRCQIDHDYYVLHQVRPKVFNDREVRFAVVLSPYLQLQYINNPEIIPNNWKCKPPPIRFIGEVSKSEIQKLSAQFVTDGLFSFEVDTDRLIPSWLPEFPVEFYQSQDDHIAYLKLKKNRPSKDVWEFLDPIPISAFIRSAVPLPKHIKKKIGPWATRFVHHLQTIVRVNNNRLTRPILYLAVLTDFLAAVRKSPSSYDPDKYFEILFDKNRSQIEDCCSKTVHDGQVIPKDYSHRHTGAIPTIAQLPCGLYDPLRRVAELCCSLSVLWDKADRNLLSRLTQFRLSTLGLLSGRESESDMWQSLLAYCGGRKLSDEGERTGQKCLKYPLVLGQEEICPSCGKLICPDCKSCSDTCPDQKKRLEVYKQQIAAEKEANRNQNDQRQLAPSGGQNPSSADAVDLGWLDYGEPPLYLYEDDPGYWEAVEREFAEH